MTDRELFQETFNQLHASKETISSVITMVQQKNVSQKKYKAAKTIALVAAVIAALTTTACATGLVDYLEAALTRAIQPSSIIKATLTEASISTEKPDMRDSMGNPIAMPDMERVSTDEETVTTLTGNYLYDMDAVLALDNDPTITFDSFIIDEQGMGIITYTVSDPNGVHWDNAGYGAISSIDGTLEPQIWIDGTALCDSRIYLIDGDNTDTEIHVAQYFGSCQEYQVGQSLMLTVPGEKVALRITPEQCAPITEFTDEQGHELILSVFGLRMGWHSAEELVTDEIILHYTDGTNYVVMNDDILNTSLSYWQVSAITTGEYTYEYICQMFNRPVDVGRVESVTITGQTYTDDLSVVTFTFFQ
jgi:hypothetical protein